jgi:APA family basic amino acid/polyamine antiporter
VNYWGVRKGARVNNGTALVKIAAIVVLAMYALLHGGGSWGHFASIAPGAERVPLTNFGLALSPVLFSYLGWNAPIYVASEIREPQRNLPRALFLGLAICTALYLLLNVVYLYALPIEQLAGSVRSGEAAAEVLWGPTGATVVAVLVLASVLGCLHATILVGPRIAYAMALDDVFFAGAERVHERYRTPHRAIVAQAVTAIALVLVLRRFPSVLDYTTFAIVLATITDTSALYVLRWRRPAQPRPYRAWGYPWLPALYIVANAGIATAMLIGRPWECAVALAVAAAGLPFYAYFHRRMPAASE